MEDKVVDQLLKAEAEAHKLIEEAYKKKQEKLREAQQAADKEIEVFKKQEQERFQKEIDKRFGSGNDEAELERKTRDEITQINKAYETKKSQVIDLLINRVMNVELEIPNVVKKSLALQNQ